MYNRDSDILNIEHLSLSFYTPRGEIESVRDVSFVLKEGEILGIVGESGCGKSILCKSIMKLIPPIAKIKSGRITADGTDITGYSEQKMYKLRGSFAAYVFQNPMTSLNPTLTVGEQIGEAVRLHQASCSDCNKACRSGINETAAAGEASDSTEGQQEEGTRKKLYEENAAAGQEDTKEKLTAANKNSDSAAVRDTVIRLLKLVGIEQADKRIDMYPHEFSGGMRQRAVIAMALASRPKVIFADEPTTALDERTGGQILEVFDRIRHELGTSIIFVSHDLRAVRRIADRIMVMYEGCIVEEGSTEEIFLRPKHPYTKILLQASDLAGTDKAESRHISSDNAANQQYSVTDNAAGQHFSTGNAAKQCSAEVLLDISELDYTYRRADGLSVHALRNTTFKVNRGEIFGIIGESGSGKSTLAKCIMNIIRPDSGNILYNGTDICDRAAYKRVQKSLQISRQLIFQDSDSALNPRMTVADIITEPMRINHIKPEHGKTYHETAVSLMHSAGLDAEYADKYPSELSGGERQRTAIARAISVRPKLIIADEALASLDPPVQARIAELFRRMQAEYGFTLIFISHDMHMVKHLCGRAAVLKHGRVAEVLSL